MLHSHLSIFSDLPHAPSHRNLGHVLIPRCRGWHKRSFGSKWRRSNAYMYIQRIHREFEVFERTISQKLPDPFKKCNLIFSFLRYHISEASRKYWHFHNRPFTTASVLLLFIKTIKVVDVIDRYLFLPEVLQWSRSSISRILHWTFYDIPKSRSRHIEISYNPSC